MRIIIMGPPGSGKGTQAEKLCKEFPMQHISTGDILRGAVKEGNELGVKAKDYMDKGNLVPDELIIAIMRQRLQEPDCKHGFLLDGFPRTVKQAKALDEMLKDLGMSLDSVVLIDVDDDEVVKRISGRRMCDCGASYHILYKRPKVMGVCDRCGKNIYQRQDDKEETVRNRLKIYHKQTHPLINYYKKKGILEKVNGVQEMDDVFVDIVRAIK